MPFSVRFVVAHPARSIRCIVLKKRKRFVALEVLASSFHAYATAEARGRFTEPHSSSRLVAHNIPPAWSRERGRVGLVAGNS